MIEITQLGNSGKTLIGEYILMNYLICASECWVSAEMVCEFNQPYQSFNSSVPTISTL